LNFIKIYPILFDNIKRFACLDYVPTEDDVKQTGYRIMGTTEEIRFLYQGITFRVFDLETESVGKKYIHYFQDCAAILFFVALNDFDRKCEEDYNTTKLQQAVTQFEQVLHNRWFNDTSIVLFFTKVSDFRNRIRSVDLSVCFPEYKGGLNYEAALGFLAHKFSSLNHSTLKQVYPHPMDENDTEQVLNYIVTAVQDIIFRNNLRRSGFLY